MKLTDLSPREREVAELVGHGLDYDAIARKLRNLRSLRGSAISPRTVREHVQRIAARISGDVQPPRPYIVVMRWAIEQQRHVA